MPTWAERPRITDEERDEVVLPLARLAAVRRRHDLARRAALAALHPALSATAADPPAAAPAAARDDAGTGGPSGPSTDRGPGSAPGWVVGVAGGVAVGKSTVARLLAELLPAEVGGPVVVVSIDGFLRTNAELDERGLTARKGAPETYDLAALRTLLTDVRAGTAATDAPVYAHRLQDRDPGRTIRVDAPAVLVLEGLSALAGPDTGGVADLVDLGVYVDAAEDDARAWYLDRFRAWRVAAAEDEGAYLHRIADMPDADADALALHVWDETNAPNVREHVLPTRAHADVVLEKGPDHRVERVLVRPV
ncbi:unannotated protein [freshwater metagenome]|uniref:Unannotated protein n=1 Tax=freshwater metagenome TaxID=449393 RepID=A0A6J7HZY1_9ZZZZ|nr:type I pantothenate kinase [Actinomycetota bacterium]